MMNKIPKGFFEMVPGQLVRSAGKKYRITHLVTVDTVFAQDEETLESTRLRIDTLEAFVEDDSKDIPLTKDLSLYSEKEWAIAQRRFQAIKPLLDNPIRTRLDAEAIATAQGIHAATLYKWLSAYQKAGNVSALVPTKRGRATGTRMLNAEQEKLIASVINEDYLTKQRKKKQDVIDEVQRRARLAKISAPHGNTIRSRISMLPVAETLRRRGQREQARNLYEPLQGKYPGADFPFAVVQIDHTPADIILVDEIHRQPIGRPWLTVAIDVNTRMVAGLYVTFDKPNSTAVAMCLSHAICPKREYMAGLGVSGDWPVWGVMNVVHSDNGKEFRGAALERGCDEYAIDLQWRPPLRPHYGGHIERYMGTLANQIHKLPGTTFSNPRHRAKYDSEAESALTLKEFEYQLVEFIVNVYHQRNHSELGMPPRKKWELGILGNATSPGIGILPVPTDPVKLLLDFLPFFERSVQQYGIQIDLINYYDPVLDPYINSVDPNNPNARRQFLVRRDPRDISKIFFFDPIAKAYFPIPYANVGHPPISAWELKEVRRTLKEQGKHDVDEDVIFEALGRLREAVEKSLHKTKSARRHAARSPLKKQAEAVEETKTPRLSPPLNPLFDNEEDPFAHPVNPFDDVSLTR